MRFSAESNDAGTAGFWDIDERYAWLSEAGDPLEKLKAVVPQAAGQGPEALRWRQWRPTALRPMLMFKVLVLHAPYNLSDQAESMIQDRMSLMHFLGLGLSEKVPDAKTIRVYEQLVG